MNAQKAYWFILVLVNIPVFLGLGRLIFRDWDGFMEALRLWCSVDWWLTLQREWREDRWGTSKLPVFLVLCGALPALEYLMFARSTVAKPPARIISLVTNLPLVQ